ncbi:MAG: hypothetical protein GVY28_13650 [Alphaproteobacteria bacterium]|nr:hypothetical protein [Alphaproteobacteria bacterium]
MSERSTDRHPGTGDTAPPAPSWRLDGGPRRFDGVEDAVVIADDPVFHLDQGTIALWFRADALGGIRALLSKQSAGRDEGGHLDILIRDDWIQVRLQSATEDHHVRSADGTVVPGEAQHLAVSFGPDGLQLFVDGTPVAEAGYPGGLWFGDTGNREPITLGASQHLSGDHLADPLDRGFEGEIGGVTVHDRQLATAEVEALAAAVPPETEPEPAPEPGPEPEPEPAPDRPTDPDRVLIGTDDDDVLVGGTGNDRLEGGPGDDLLDGDGTLAGGEDGAGAPPAGPTLEDAAGSPGTGTGGPPPPTAAAGDPAPAPIAAWSFNDGWDGAPGPADPRDDAALVADGIAGGAARFDGIDDVAVIADDPMFHLEEGTIGLWFKADALGGIQALFSKQSAGLDDGGHLDLLIRDDWIQVRLQSDTGDTYLRSADSSVAEGAWTHVAVGFGSDGLALFLDGAEVARSSYTGGLWLGDAGNEEPITLGAGQNVSGDGVADRLTRWFDGAIDEVAIFDRQLSPEEVAAVRAADLDADDGGGGTDGDDLLLGDAGDDLLIGGGGDDRLEGGAGDDVLDGGPGDDVLIGGPGADVMDGGTGADVFVFDTVEPDAVDTVTFDAGADRILVEGAVAGLRVESTDDGADLFAAGIGGEVLIAQVVARDGGPLDNADLGLAATTGAETDSLFG